MRDRCSAAQTRESTDGVFYSSLTRCRVWVLEVKSWNQNIIALSCFQSCIREQFLYRWIILYCHWLGPQQIKWVPFLLVPFLLCGITLSVVRWEVPGLVDFGWSQFNFCKLQNPDPMDLVALSHEPSSRAVQAPSNLTAPSILEPVTSCFSGPAQIDCVFVLTKVAVRGRQCYQNLVESFVLSGISCPVLA